jgi:hypothetical protein
MLNKPISFTASELTEAVNKLPAMPLRMKGIFKPKGVRTTTVTIDIKQGRLVLVENQDRSAQPKHMAGRGSKRSAVNLECAHLPLSDTVRPEDIQDLRGFGTDQPVGPETVINDKMQDLKNSIDMTVEFHRVGAAKGIVYDADGTTELHNLFEVFKVPQKKMDIAFPTGAQKFNPILNAIMAAKRYAEQKLGGIPVSRFEAMIGSEFYDKLTTHELVRVAYEMWLANQQDWGDNDYRKRGFTYGGVTWIETSEIINGRALVEPDKGHMYPVGLDCFMEYHAPANWIDAANSIGLPFYAQMEPLPMKRGHNLEVQSSPLCLCTVPEALVELAAK